MNSNGNNVTTTQGFVSSGPASLDSNTPGHLNLDDDQDIKQELYLIQIAEKEEMKKKFVNADKEDQYQEQEEDDKDFGLNLNYEMHRLESEQNKIFNDMDREQQRHQKNTRFQRRYR